MGSWAPTETGATASASLSSIAWRDFAAAGCDTLNAVPRHEAMALAVQIFWSPGKAHRHRVTRVAGC
jgi:hypothetical protein